MPRLRKPLKCFLCAVLSVSIFFTALLRPSVKAEAAAVTGGIALEKILETLIISAGITYLGVELGSDTANRIRNDSEAYQNLKSSILSGSVVSGALADALSWSEKFSTEGSSALDDNYVYESPSGFRVTNGGGNKPSGSIGAAINVGLSAKLIQAAKDAVKEWADSSANEFTEYYVDDNISSLGKLSGVYPKTVSYSTASVSACFDSIDCIDAFFACEGASDYLREQGYNDDNSYFLLMDNYLYIIPLDCFLLINFLRSRFAGYYIERSKFNEFINLAGLKSGYDCVSWLCNSGNPIGSPSSRVYAFSDGSFELRDGLFDLANFLGSKAILFNADAAIESGCCIRQFHVTDKFLSVIDYTYGKSFKLEYDLAKAPNYRDVCDSPNGYVEYAIPYSMITGGSFSNLAEMVQYVNSLNESLREWQDSQDKNHNEDIEQGNDILDAINQAVKGISGLSDLIGDIAASILELPLSIAEYIQDKITEIFPDSISVGETVLNLPDIIANLPDTTAGAIQDKIIEVFPNSVSVGDAIIELPDIVRGLPDVMKDNFKDMLTDFNPVIEIPEIKIPEITIPEINIPPIEVPAPDVNVELNPNYEITVQNDYTGLSDIISNAVEGLLIKLFVPDETLVLDKVGNIKLYFAFIDDIKDYINIFTDKVFGITPSPYFHIPIGHERSKYNYGLSKEIIIDVSWYSEYKNYGDKIITAICWGFFLWRMFIRLPDIISGSGGSIMASYNSYHNYEKSTKTKGD